VLERRKTNASLGVARRLTKGITSDASPATAAAGIAKAGYACGLDGQTADDRADARVAGHISEPPMRSSMSMP